MRIEQIYFYYSLFLFNTARKICKDASPNCLEYLNADARACTNDEFVWHTCPKTCGYCRKLEGEYFLKYHFKKEVNTINKNLKHFIF